MNHRHLLLALTLFAAPLFATAQQTNDVAIWITDSEFKDPTISDELESATLEFDEDLGYGISFNHFWTNAFSTEFAYHNFGADMTIEFDDGGRFHAGEVDATSLTAAAQWHFRRATRFSPYVGAGVSYLQGDFKPFEESDTYDFSPETSWVANFGANIAITNQLAIALDAKVLPWEPKEEDDEAIDRIDVSPVLLSAGLRFRF